MGTERGNEPPPTLTSERLSYRRLSEDRLDRFHSLAVDPHIRAFMLDGIVVERAWAATVLAASDTLFAERGVGIWLIYDGEEAIGFCGFRRFEEPEPQLLYAFTEPHIGRGYATEAAQALIGKVEGLGWKQIVSAVDAPNAVSIRVLRKLGFVQVFSFPGAFGRQFYFRKSLARPLPATPEVRTLLEREGIVADREIFELILAGERIRIERIVSSGQCTPEGTWYEQDEHEWVLLLQGAARLAYPDGKIVRLGPGDSLLLPAGRKHRVQWTEPETPTVWLAVFFR